MTHSSDLRVLEGSGKPAHEDAQDLADAIKDAVYAYANRMTVAAAIGTLEIVKYELMMEHDDED